MRFFPTTRRRFLIGGIEVLGLASLAPSVLARSMAGAAWDGEERVLVVIQLTGGNDGLNTVVPFRQDAYFRARPAISLPIGRLHRLDDEHGLHPEMAGCSKLLQDGLLGVVHGVGYPQADRSHFRSMQVWHTADPRTAFGVGTQRPTSGWLGRLAEQLGASAALPALFLGGGDLPLSLATSRGFTPSVRDAEGFRLSEPSPGFAASRGRLLETAAGAAEEPSAKNVAWMRRAARSTYDAAARMQVLAAAPSASGYPDLPLAQHLALAAQLIAGGFGTRVFGLELGGFDTHALQLTSQAAQLDELSRSLLAFQSDLAKKGVAKRVVTLVFSEFGRRVAENASRGTDHGAAAPAFLIGEPVRGGLFGTPPDLSHLDQGDVPFTTDFRSLYTTLESDWLGLEPSTHLPALHGILG